MSKKNKKDKFVDPYEAAYLRAQQDIENASCDVSDNIEFDDDGTPYEVDDRDYVYDEAPQETSAVTPAYMDFIMQGTKKGKKKKRRFTEDTGDYDLIGEPKEEHNTTRKILEEMAGKMMEEDEEETPHAEIPDDLKELFPGEFDESSVFIGDGTENDGWFGGPTDDEMEQEEDYPEEEDEYDIPQETIEDPYPEVPNGIHIGFNEDPEPIEAQVPKHSYVEPAPEPVEMNPSPVGETPQTAQPSWLDLSRLCAMQFIPIEPLGRLLIDDRIAPTPVISTVINLQCFDVNQDRLLGYIKGDDNKLDLTFINKIQDAVWVYMLSSKHPAAIFTKENFVEAFGDIDHMDNKNFKFVYDSRNENTIGGRIYAYHIPANQQRKYNNYVKAVAHGFTDDAGFYPNLEESERTLIAQLLVNVHIAEHIQQEREIFASHLPDYVEAYRMTPSDHGANYPMFNQIMEYVQLVRTHRATEIGQVKNTMVDLNKIADVYEFNDIRDVCWNLFNVINNGASTEDDDDDMDDELLDSIDESDEDDDMATDVDDDYSGLKYGPSSVNMPEIKDVDEDGDPMEGLASQIMNYADDETDYTSYLNQAAIQEEVHDPNAQAIKDIPDEFYEAYTKNAAKHGLDVMTKDALLDKMNKNVTGTMTFVQKTDNTAEVISTPKEIVGEPKEEPAKKEDVGSSTMMQALAKAGYNASPAKEKPPVTSLGSVPVFRK